VIIKVGDFKKGIFLWNTPKSHSRQPKIYIGNTEGKKVSPPFEGGVAGTIDYLIFTKLFSGRGG
jgi:hypothetical protein